MALLTDENNGTSQVDGAYLDYAAATPMAPEVVQAMLPYFTQRFYNPSAPYALAREARTDLEGARARLAHLIGARPDCVTLTAGATEANNLAFAATTGHVVTDAIEHESVLACAEARPHTIVPVSTDGRVDPAVVAKALTPRTQLVSIELANGEIGTIQPIRQIAAVVRSERERRLEASEDTPIYLHVDASQAAGWLSVDVTSLGADLLTLSAAKVYGPKQVGLLWSAEGIPLRPLVLGGGQENGVRSGTENVAGVVGFSVALELAQRERRAEAARVSALRDRLQASLLQRFPWARVSGPQRQKLRLPNLLHVSFPCVEARRLVILLERQGVSVGTGSACAASRMQVSHVLDAIGLPREVSRGSLRMTLGRQTTRRQVDFAADAIERAVTSELQRTGVDEVQLLERYGSSRGAARLGGRA
ncbi:MAG: cysteine desulfurase family protein [Coriobacteriales bacterium]|nr:cysteine desulfurase family protein [Coriobacteriales bacterium]